MFPIRALALSQIPPVATRSEAKVLKPTGPRLRFPIQQMRSPSQVPPYDSANLNVTVRQAPSDPVSASAHYAHHRCTRISTSRISTRHGGRSQSIATRPERILSAAEPRALTKDRAMLAVRLPTALAGLLIGSEGIAEYGVPWICRVAGSGQRSRHAANLHPR